MTGIEAISNKISATGTEKKEVIGKDAFLQMLVAQLKYQNPLDPMKDADFAAQLAQFSSLEQLQNVVKEIKTLGENQLELRNAYAVSMIGKEVTAGQDNSDESVTGVVEALQYKVNGAYLTIGDKEVNLKNVTHVRDKIKI